MMNLNKCNLTLFLAFVEDIWLPDTEPPLPTTTTESPPPPPPPLPTLPPVNNECSYLCRRVASCKDILANYPSQSASVCKDDANGGHGGGGGGGGGFNWHCFEESHQHASLGWQCPARFGCPGGHIRSGFGTSVELQRRCLPLHTCKYFAYMYGHLNGLHEEVFQLC